MHSNEDAQAAARRQALEKLPEALVFLTLIGVLALAFSGVKLAGYLLGALLLMVPAGLVFIVFAAAVTQCLGRPGQVEPRE